MHLDPPFLQLPRDQVGGADFLQAQFGMRVDVVADRDEFILIGTGAIEGGLAHQTPEDPRISVLCWPSLGK